MSSMPRSLVERVGTRLNVDRLRSDIERTGTFGAVDEEGHGRTALAADDANAAAREYLVDRLEAADCSVRVDAVGNVTGRWVPPGADPDAAPVASESHLDSVVQGGIFNGPLGVYAALEGVRAIQDAVDGGVTFERPLEVVSFTEEEGHRFSDGLLVSTVAAGHTSVAEALALIDDGVSLGDALEDVGFRGEGRLDAAAWSDWLELHLEQSRTLEQAEVPVGIVTSIAGTARCTVEIEGEANHAGTTGMDDRADALVAADDVVRAVERIATDVAGQDGRAVGTVGCIDVEPGAVNVVPGRAVLKIGLSTRRPTGLSDSSTASRVPSKTSNPSGRSRRAWNGRTTRLRFRCTTGVTRRSRTRRTCSTSIRCRSTPEPGTTPCASGPVPTWGCCSCHLERVSLTARESGPTGRTASTEPASSLAGSPHSREGPTGEVSRPTARPATYGRTARRIGRTNTDGTRRARPADRVATAGGKRTPFDQ